MHPYWSRNILLITFFESKQRKREPFAEDKFDVTILHISNLLVASSCQNNLHVSFPDRKQLRKIYFESKQQATNQLSSMEKNNFSQIT